MSPEQTSEILKMLLTLATMLATVIANRKARAHHKRRKVANAQ